MGLGYSAVSLDANPKFLAFVCQENMTYDCENIDYNNDTVIVPCHSCFMKVEHHKSHVICFCNFLILFYHICFCYIFICGVRSS